MTGGSLLLASLLLQVGLTANRGHRRRKISTRWTRLDPLGLGVPPGAPAPGRQHVGPCHGPRRWAPSRFRGHSAWGCSGPSQRWLWGGSRARGGGHLAEGQYSLGCRPVLSSRGNKLCSKGAFESQDPCGARVLLWQLLLDLPPVRWWCWHLCLARAFPPSKFPPRSH